MTQRSKEGNAMKAKAAEANNSSDSKVSALRLALRSAPQ